VSRRLHAHFSPSREVMLRFSWLSSVPTVPQIDDSVTAYSLIISFLLWIVIQGQTYFIRIYHQKTP
jgi:hypothetical protein